ncbi:bifunctional diguanylate cyclase/phosphodiesterase [Paenisporosarcina sp. TG20]|uniref:sensor domain-containing protein n=1 Tax=Paenisporosarcina sp. TG20 TaxID=1211706 RepID=UPI0002FC097F|nr:bifunctional diguanylate cyclase/phosphodiesterase [Paenisporosarcina sp. TG20]
MRGVQQLLENGSGVLNHIPLPMMLTANDAKVLWWSEDAEKAFGYKADEIVGKYFPFGESSETLQTKCNQVLQCENSLRFENFILQSKQGESVHTSAVLYPITIGNQHYVMFTFEIDNINYNASAHELESFKLGIDETFMVTHLDIDGLITYANTLFLKSSKWTPKRVIGKSFWKLFPEESAEKVVDPIWLELKSHRVWQGSVEKLTKDGETYWVDMIAIPVLSANDELLYISILEKDITEKKRLQIHLEQIAYVDPETGLMSRHRLENIVSGLIAEGRHFSFIFLDIDKFYTLKDMHDEDSETTLLLEFANRMKLYFQDSSIARVGEDKFVVLTPLSDWFIQGFLSYLKQYPIYIRNKAIPISISGGITRYPEDQLTFSQLMNASSAIINKVKQEGGGNIVSLSKANHLALSKKTMIEKRLIEALHHKDLTVMFQPQVDLSTGKIDTVEALVRWEDAVLGTVSPNELIPIAEETGMIHDIGSFMLEKACEQAALWAENDMPMKVSVNTSIREFRDKDMVKKIRQTLEKFDCPARLLQIEITEKFALEAESDQSIIRQMVQLQKDGIVFILDDFGTGYASFRYMQLLPISCLKIDQSFISGILKQEKLKKLVRGMIQFGKSMDIRVFAEGVETKEQFDLLTELGCDAIQGYYISRPVVASEIGELYK